MHVPHFMRVATGIMLAGAATACDQANQISEPTSSLASGSATSGGFQFTPLAGSTACTDGGNVSEPFAVPAGFTQSIVASEAQVPLDNWDMNTQNETGPQAGRFLFRTHELTANAGVSVTDLETGASRILAQRADWERFDGLVWTPWGTLLAAEEVNPGPTVLEDPAVPQALAGLVYEIDPQTGAAVARPAVGSRSHEGMRFDPQGNLYGISEASPPTGGYIYRFVPDQQGDLSSGQLYVLKVIASTSDRTGEAIWLPLDRNAAQVNSDAAATAAGATGYNRPEDVEITTSTGNNRGGANVLYVAVTGEDRVLAIDLREPQGGSGHETAFVYDYVRVGLNATSEFHMPDNLALDRNGNLFIAEDPATAPTTRRGDDIWAAPASGGGQHQPSEEIALFASLTDCQSEPTGIYFDQSDWSLHVDAQHRGGDRLDLSVAIQPAK